MRHQPYDSIEQRIDSNAFEARFYAGQLRTYDGQFLPTQYDRWAYLAARRAAHYARALRPELFES